MLKGLLRVVFDLLQLLELFFLLLDLLLLLRDLGLALLLLHAQFLDDVGVLQLRLGQLFTLKRAPISKTHSQVKADTDEAVYIMSEIKTCDINTLM